MRFFLALVFALIVAGNVNAEEYGTYDLEKLLIVKATPSGNKYAFDHGYLNRIMSDLAAHAGSYPPQVGKIIAAIRSGQVEIKQTGS